MTTTATLSLSPAGDARHSNGRRFRLIATILALFMTLVLSPRLDAASKRHLGAPVFDTEAETTHRQVGWDDFKSGGTNPAGWNRWSSGTFAHILSRLHLGAYKIEPRLSDGGAWIAAVSDIRPYAVMDKYHSAVKPGARKPDVLAHEQLHFDNSELVARRLTVEMRTLVGHGATAEEARDQLDEAIRQRFAQGQQELLDLQRQYDGETHHGQSRKQQKKWAVKIENMFRQATQALVEELENGSPGSR